MSFNNLVFIKVIIQQILLWYFLIILFDNVIVIKLSNDILIYQSDMFLIISFDNSILIKVLIYLLICHSDIILISSNNNNNYQILMYFDGIISWYIDI